ncbi:kinesin-like protein klp-3 isoform X2 [Ptychodera flava]|uniref:kinesin-like protein klp-3 isoform X2 n=1 Tax=Ptychodera flava TaxID=63121 RepID=UPI003969D5C1
MGSGSSSGARPQTGTSGRSSNNQQPMSRNVRRKLEARQRQRDFEEVEFQADPPVTGQRQDQMLSMAVQMQELGEDIVFETFLHRSGRSYTCLVQGGQRFYLDSWQTQEWQLFPKEWLSQGTIQKETTIHDEPEHNPVSYNDQPGTSAGFDLEMEDVEIGGVGGNDDDRAGSFVHPSRGKILTYIFEERRNIHCYFDEMSGSWIKIPISWEQHHDFVKPLVQQIMETCPAWTDRHDVIAALRASNYDLDDCIATYFTVGDTGNLDTGGRLTGKNAEAMKQKDEKIKKLEAKLAKLKPNYEEACRLNKTIQNENETFKEELQRLREKISELEVDAKTAQLRVASLQQERPRTARPMTARPITPKPQTPKAPEPEPEPEPVVVGPFIDQDTLKAVDVGARELDKMNMNLKSLVQRGFADLTKLAQQAMAGLSQLKNMDSSTSTELDELRVLYRKECLQRKILYNKIQELRGNIRVFCRCRRDDRVDCALDFPSDHELLCQNPAGGTKKYKFDKVFTPASTQEEVFDEVTPIITSCVDGYNVCLMAYGQTGSGKTFTMMGPSDNPGVNIRAVTELLKICAERQKVSYKLTVSLLEVYNENLQDLLTSKGSPSLDIKMNGKKLVVQGLTEVEVKTIADIKAVMAKGDENRSVAATKMNSTSSRSHLLLIIQLEGVDKVSNATSYGSLTLVDLAGSERIAKTGATGQTLVEAAAINKSLTSLGQVFSSLRSNALHVPYRNSKLTHLLQPSLGGDAKAALFVNVSPAADNISETISTLTFGSNAKQVALGKATQNVKK